MLNLLQSTMLYHTPQPPDELNCYVFGKNSQQDASVALAKKASSPLWQGCFNNYHKFELTIQFHNDIIYTCFNFIQRN